MTIFKEGIHYNTIQNAVKPYGAWQTFKILKNDNSDTDFFITNIYLAGDISPDNFKEVQNMFEDLQFERAMFTGDFNAKTKLWIENVRCRIEMASKS